jgi:hypothetical protein
VTEATRRRVVVSSPRIHGVRRSRGYAVRREIDEQTQLGEVFMRSLMRAQLRLALLICAGLALLLGGLPLLFAAFPTLRRLDVFGLELPWLALGVLVYPLLVAGAGFYVRQAERNERDFADLVDRS